MDERRRWSRWRATEGGRWSGVRWGSTTIRAAPVAMAGGSFLMLAPAGLAKGGERTDLRRKRRQTDKQRQETRDGEARQRKCKRRTGERISRMRQQRGPREEGPGLLLYSYDRVLSAAGQAAADPDFNERVRAQKSHKWLGCCCRLEDLGEAGQELGITEYPPSSGNLGSELLLLLLFDASARWRAVRLHVRTVHVQTPYSTRYRVHVGRLTGFGPSLELLVLLSLRVCEHEVVW
jgi:hypothetical protein